MLNNLNLIFLVICKFYIFQDQTIKLGGAMGTLMCDVHAEVQWSTLNCDGPFADVQISIRRVMLV